ACGRRSVDRQRQTGVVRNARGSCSDGDRKGSDRRVEADGDCAPVFGRLACRSLGREFGAPGVHPRWARKRFACRTRGGRTGFWVAVCRGGNWVAGICAGAASTARNSKANRTSERNETHARTELPPS